MGQQAEKLLAAGIAAIGRKTKKPLCDNQGALLDSFPSDVLEIEIPATRAVSVTHEGNCDRPGVKPQVACLTPPRPQTYQRGEKVADAAAARARAIPTPALRTDHLAALSPVTAGQHIQNFGRRQGSRTRRTPRTV